MGENSAIAWTDNTFSPWEGCEKVSPGCKHCYAEERNERFNGGKHWGPDSPRLLRSPAHWLKPKRWNREAAAAGKRTRVFCSSVSDVFEDRCDLVGERARLFSLVAETPALDWLLLTKRPENIDALLPQRFRQWSRHDDGPTPHIWLGATVENQEWADRRMPVLLDVHAPGVIRFASVEPLLEPVDLRAYLKPTLVARDGGERLQHPDSRVGKTGGRWSWGLDWVIVGGESGRKARPFDLAWASSVVAQCREAGVPVFVKQMGSRPVVDGARLFYQHKAGEDPAEWPEDLRIRMMPGEVWT